MRQIILFLLIVSASQAEITWERRQLHGDFFSEGAAIGDINGDGKPDVVAGPFWWEGPAFEKKHAYYEPKIFSINGYSDNFFAYVHDFNADQKNDILILGFPGKEARLYMNPGVHDDKPWPMHIVADVVDNESPVFTDITGDGKPEIVCSTGGKFGWFAPNWDKPTEKWPFVAVTDDMKVAKFTHGLGVGDVNGDGKLDLLEARRWWENTGANTWTQHNFAAGVGGGAQMFAYDFDGNGTNDVFTSLQAHRYGVAVYLQQKEAPNWKRVMLASEQPQDNDYGIVFSQPHAAALADINGDGVQDIVTGKRYWAHNGHDPDERGHRVVYWYETKRDGKGGVDFIPHLADANSSVGVDVTVGDVTGDKLPDIVVGNKAGVYILTQKRTEAAAVAPVKLYGPGLKPQSDYAHGQSPQDALKSMQLPSGFKAELIASEPDIVQPIAFTFDERGRIWVIEGNSYPKPRETGAGQDRIIILEDSNGDGSYETKKVFCEGINLASGIELGFGGVWVGAAPYLMFIPRDGDRPFERTEGTEKTQGTPTQASLQSFSSFESLPLAPGLSFKAHILLDGWGSQDTHETLNSFIWGPDGWLYGCHGVFTHSKVGKPGAPDDQRTPINAGVWRYHPVRHEFEVFAEGTSNPWGLDYDQNGEFFVTACVIPHLYHIVPGGRYHRQAGQHFNPYTYEDIETIADHAHYAGNPRPDVTFDKTTGAGVMNDDTNALGGGHAHCGLAIYQSNLFPPDFRNKLIFGNLHGHRLVTDYTDTHGSTYVGKHGSDFMRSNDMNFIPVTQKVGPDGALYVSDWADKQICHRGSNAVENWDRSNGRIYRITYESTVGVKALADSPSSPKGSSPSLPKAPFDLSKENAETLAKLAVQTENEWFSRMARRVLMEKRQANHNLQNAVSEMRRSFASETPIGSRLRALWALHATNAIPSGLDAENLFKEDRLRAWDIRLTSSDRSKLPLSSQQQGIPPLAERSFDHHTVSPPSMVEALLEASASSVLVRRELASSMAHPRLWDDETPIKFATALLKHGEDKDDPMIPLLIWYGIEPIVGADPKAALELAKISKMPKVTEFIYRRMGAEETGRTGLLALATETKDAAQRNTLLQTVLLAARSGNKITKPDNWTALRQKVASASAKTPASATKVAATLLELEAYMGVPEAISSFRQQLTPAAIDILVRVRDADTAGLLINAIRSGDKPLTRRAIQALATLQHPDTSKALSEKFASFDPATQQDAINTLATTTDGAKALLHLAKDKKAIISPFLARQLAAFKNTEIDTLLKDAFGDLNAPKADLEERKKKFRDLLTPAVLAKADASKGKILFNAVCGQCHQLFGQGQKVGPDLTGSNRANFDYVLDNVLDPNAVIGKDYQLNLFELKDGRIASGVVKEETPAVIRLAMPGGAEQTISTAEIKNRTASKASTMPEGLFDALPAEQLAQLVAYLQSGASAAVAAKSVEGALEGETLKVLQVTGGRTGRQGMGGFGSEWSGGAQLWWTGGKPGSTLTISLSVPTAGKYALSAALTKARDYGVIDASLDGKPVVLGFDGFNTPKVIHTGELDWGTHDLTVGEHKLTLTLSQPNPAAVPSNMVGIDYLKLEKK